MHAAKNAKLLNKGYFPQLNAEKLTPHITNARILNAKEYVAGGYCHQNYSCAIVNRDTMEVIKPVAAHDFTLMNFLCFGHFLVGGASIRGIQLFDLKSDLKTELTDSSLSGSSSGGRSFSGSGRHMEIDKSIAYMLCILPDSSADGYVARFDFRDLQGSDLFESVKNLKIEKLYEGDYIQGFCLSKQFVYVIHNETIIRINKKSRSKSTFSPYEGKEASRIATSYQIAANDYYVYGCSEQYLVLMKLEGKSIKALAKANCPEVGSQFYRNMKLFTYKGVAFVGVCYEGHFGIVLYVHCKSRLMVACYYQDANETRDEPHSIMFDKKFGRLVVCKLGGRSAVLHLKL